jgi:hypothetical protein
MALIEFYQGKSIKKYIYYMVIRFFCKTHSYRKKETSQSDFSVGCGAQLAYQLAPKILDEKLFFPGF